MRQRSASGPSVGRPGRVRRRLAACALTYLGIALVLAGFAAIGVSWDRAAGLDYIQGQFPYFVSGGLTGIGLVVVGVALMGIDVMRRDAAVQSAQLERLTATVSAMHRRLGPADPYDPAVTGEFRPRPRVSVAGAAVPTAHPEDGR